MTSPDPSSLLVVFDVDDTLYLERDYVASGFAEVGIAVRERFGVAGFAAVAWALFEQGRRGDIFDGALAELGVRANAEELGALVSSYREHRPRISLLPDVVEVLDELRRPGVKLAVLTDGPTASQAAKVEALGLRGRTAVIVLTGHYGPGYGKPHPRGYLEIAERCPARHQVYVADNPTKDFQTPRSLGWATIRVRRPGGLHAHLRDGGDVDHVLADFRGLPEILGTY